MAVRRANGDSIEAAVGRIHLPPGASVVHEHFYRDIAILELTKSSPASLSTAVCLPLEFRENIGEYGYVAGFGGHEGISDCPVAVLAATQFWPLFYKGSTLHLLCSWLCCAVLASCEAGLV
jgi:hypothetical protein